jgi:zinc and cadmium transporter
MSPLGWILVCGCVMGAISLVGAVTLLLEERTLRRLLLPLVALAAGSLIGGALFHLLPAALDEDMTPLPAFVLVAAGFTAFLATEQALQFHHCHRPTPGHTEPVTYLVLAGDAIHNFLDGLAVGGAFVIDVRLGITAWLAVAAHEVPQEIGDFAVLVHGGWSQRRALLFNFFSSISFIVGGVLAYGVSLAGNVDGLLPFAAGNFLYIAASDLIPQVNRHETAIRNVEHFAAFLAGLGLLLLLRLAEG